MSQDDLPGGLWEGFEELWEDHLGAILADLGAILVDLGSKLQVPAATAA